MTYAQTPAPRPAGDLPEAQGLYDPANEHDACGVAFVADLAGRAHHDVLRQGLAALRNLDHRGASGHDPETGDGAGILTQVPDALLRTSVDTFLPPAGEYAVGICFLPQDAGARDTAVRAISAIVRSEGMRLVTWRDVPVESGVVGRAAHLVEPVMRMLVVTKEGADGELLSGVELDRHAFCVRKRVEHEVGVYVSSLSSRTITYKGMLTTHQLGAYFLDLDDPRYATAIALVHSRFSTNTFPSWPLAHPYRFIAHNGEINTIRGNRNWMRARESLLGSGTTGSSVLPGDVTRLFPINLAGSSDSASFDEVLELLHLGGRSLPHAVLMMIPEAWENHTLMDPARRAFYEFHANVMEPWDGPANVCFTDGTQIGAVLDRNGLRPGRWARTEDGLVVLASEAGVLDLDPSTIVERGRLAPGKMFLVDTAQGRIIGDDEIKDELASAHPYADWLHAGLIDLATLPDRELTLPDHASVTRRQQVFGYTEEELRVIVSPMAKDGAEPIGSMGSDTPVAVLSKRPRLLFDYFQQMFAQVTNPPLDAIREELVTSLGRVLGPDVDLLDPSAASCRHVVMPFPVIDNNDLAKIVGINAEGDLPGFATATLRCTYPVAGGGQALQDRIVAIRAEVSAAIEKGARIIVLSDRHSDAVSAPIPSLLITGDVHHHLVREKSRTNVGLVVEAGDVREVHHVALLLGFGAAAVNPYLAFESVEDLIRTGLLEGVTPEKAVKNYVKGLGKGVLKVMSKMGVSTVASYTGAQLFEAIGLDAEIVNSSFTGTTSRIGGVGLAEIAEEVAMRHARAYPTRPTERAHRKLETGGEYQWRREGEVHLFNPETVFKLQHATRQKRYDTFQEYTAMVDRLAEETGALRGLFMLRTGTRRPVPLDEVEPVSSIVKRFATGAMSYGSISAEAHETLAVAMNNIGGKSNTGEGGEDPARLYDPKRRSAVKQVASGRFGVTSEYLVNADDIQIKMAQGAKPGEGGQLPAHKVYPWIAAVRYSTPGVGLISPPPHHDIYSIEDLAQLIHDLKNANPRARVHVKLVAEVGVGTVAAGVSKAHADVVLISGHDGGTGAAPLTSLKHAGAPWELGLAETQQTLILNGLRDRIVVQVDGQMKTGRDVVIAALLGAEEFGFATAPLVVAGCVMMRVCHLDTCPVGVATQNPLLRAKFTGKPEFVETFFEYIATEVRQLLAHLGFRTLLEAVGHTEMLDTRPAVDHWKARGLDLHPLLHLPERPFGGALHCTTTQDHGLEKALDNTLIQLCASAIDGNGPVQVEMEVRNVNRTVGTMLGSEVTRRHGGAGLPADTISVHFTGAAGQSFGAFLPRGITLRLEGEANDYVGKGLSGGRIAVFPHRQSPFLSLPSGGAEHQVIAGNVLLYGATAGELYVRGRAGERFAVRNSGARAVVEGVGDHGCEYMTGGRVVVLGRTGRNFAAGMSGGIAYVHDPSGTLAGRTNTEMVDLLPLDEEAEATVQALLTEHVAMTGSTLAERVLGSWEQEKDAFRMVLPREYAKVLAAISRAQAEGRDVDTAIMEATHG